MEQRDETQLLGYCLRPLGEKGASAVAQVLSDSEAENLRQALATFLLDESKEDPSLIEISEREVPTPPGFKSVLYRDTGFAPSQRIVTFGFRDAVVETALPLLGMAIAMFTGTWGIANLPSLLGVVKTLWSKLVVLRRPADADAIDVLEGLFRVRALHIASAEPEYPTTGEIEREVCMTNHLVQSALARLKSQAVLEIASWGGQAGDLSHEANRWRIKF